MILVTVGMHVQPFDRMVTAAERIAESVDEEVVLQRGVSEVVASGCTHVVDFCTPMELGHWMEQARVIVTHGGPGSIHRAIRAGRRPVVLPRDPRHGEHVDDHQIRFVRRLGHRVLGVYDADALVRCVCEGEDFASEDRTGLGRTDGLIGRFDAIVQEVVATPRRFDLRTRATFAHWLCRAGFRRWP